MNWLSSALIVIKCSRKAISKLQLLALSTLAMLAITLLQITPVLANQISQDIHLGTATCAGSQCHGKSTPQENRNVLLNEYTTWIGSDRHSIAYKTLESPESRSIARKLGLKNATTAKICLDCHTDNVAVEKRGPKFQITDGVGCEGCHGGAENWLVSHTDPNTTHQQNVASGLIATEDAGIRAQVCLACHAGNENQFATHQIMAAGHPRLSFELDLFTTLQPQHYTIDTDYIQRKGTSDRIQLWIEGQFHSIEQSLKVAKTRLYNGEGIFPDFAFYDCHSCHHPMSKLYWSASRADGVRPGSPRLHMPNMPVIEALVLATGNQTLADELAIVRVETVRAAQHGRRAFSAAADQLLTTLAKVRTHVESNIDRTNVDNILSSLLSASATDQASDYAEAEQLYYSYETLCEATNQYDKCAPTLESIFNTLDDEDNFDPNVLVSVSRNLGGKTRSRASQKIDRNKGRLTVRTTPDQARVRIMNIVPRYRDGIELNIGNSYDIEVSEDGFKTFRTMVVLTDREQVFNVALDPE